MQITSQDPFELLKQCHEQETPLIDNDRTIFPNVVIYDLTFQNTKSTTILQILDKNNVVLKTIYGFTPIDQLEHKIDLSNVKDILHTYQLPIYSQTLPDGYQFKISYILELEAWIIQSESNSILLRTKNDIDHYKQQRFEQSTIIANYWFDYLADLIPTKLDNLKKDLNQRILQGIFAGFDSIVRYEDNYLFFIQIIGQPIKSSLEFSQFYGLQLPKTSIFQPDLKSIEKHIDRIQRSDTELEQAGAILYINNHQYYVNTNEYLLFSKMREELLEEHVNQKQFKILLKQFKLPRPNQFYQNLFNEAIAIRQQYQQVVKLIRFGFNQLISIILNNFKKEKKFQWQQYKESLQYSFDWSTFEPSTLTRVPVYQQKENNNGILFLIVGLPGQGCTYLTTKFQQISQKIQVIAQESELHQEQKENSVLIYDHNCSPVEADKLINSVSLKVYVLHPLINSFEDKSFAIPFSFEYLMGCMKRKCHNIEQVQQFIKRLKQFEGFDFKFNEQIKGTIGFPLVNTEIKIDSNILFDDFLDSYEFGQKKHFQNLLHSLQNTTIPTIIDYDQDLKELCRQILPNLNQLRTIESISKVDKQKQKQQQNKGEIKQIYNPTYLPQSLSFQVKNIHASRDKLNKWIRDCLNSAEEHFKDTEISSINQAFKKQTLEYSEQIYNQEKDLFISLLSIANQDQSVRQLPYFKNFQLDKECEILVKTLFISKEGLICALVDGLNLPCQNPYPHINIYTKTVKAKDSSEFIAQTIFQNRELKAIYKSKEIFENVHQNYFYKENIKLRNVSHNVYVITLKDGVFLNTISTDRI